MSESSCNSTAYREWYASEYEPTEDLPLSLYQIRTDLVKVTRSDKHWKLMNFDEDHDEFLDLYAGRRPKRLNITKGQTMTASTLWCEEKLGEIEVSSAGSHGSQSLLNADHHDTMCMKYCHASDYLRSDAIKTSECSCLELSTGKDEISYTTEGDFCLQNSGYLLCEQVDELNTCKDCELEDFMCPRREYDKIEIPLKGFGDECNASLMLQCSGLLLSVAYVATFSLLFR